MYYFNASAVKKYTEVFLLFNFLKSPMLFYAHFLEIIFDEIIWLYLAATSY